MQFTYRIEGVLKVPEGSKLADRGSGIILPTGETLKIWEALELHQTDADDLGGVSGEYRDLGFDEAIDMGIFYDGDPATYEEA